ncbi:MAG: hypothetical protein CMF58_04140 [Lentimicrobiaceae bacterium]|nr:hypothetical protein [Lentimicrobiaceae bacterium]
MKLIEDEICPRCGKPFDCSKSGKCWCYEISLPQSLQDAIGQKYSTCLCPSCLKALATGNEVVI